MDILGLGIIQITDWFLYLILALVALYIYLTWNFDYFTKRGIPGPPPKPLFGTMLSFFFRETIDIDIEGRKKYGYVYGIFVGRKPQWMVTDPEILKHILIKDHSNFIDRQRFASSKFLDLMLTSSRGDHWRFLRSTMSPTFSTSKLKMMFHQINECADSLVENLKTKADEGEHVSLKESFGAFTMDAIASTAFGIQLDSQNDKKSPFVAQAKKVFDLQSFVHLIILGLCLPWFMNLLRKFDIDLFFDKESIDFFRDITKKAVEARKDSNQKRTDFLQLVMNAEKEDTDDETNTDSINKRGLTSDELIAQSVLIFLAGYDTTSNAIGFLIYELTLNPDIQEKLYEEIISVVKDKEEIDYNMLSEMEFLEMCCQESMRKYSPAIRVDRVCTKTTTIDGFTFEKDQVVNIPINAIHYDEKIWPNPHKFDPYRFTGEEKAKRQPLAHMPFGLGPRMCIASRLALTEYKLAVVRTVINFKCIQTEKTERPPLKMFKFGGRPVNDVLIKMERR